MPLAEAWLLLDEMNRHNDHLRSTVRKHKGRIQAVVDLGRGEY